MTVFVAFHQSNKGTKNRGQKADDRQKGNIEFSIADFI